MSSPVYNLFRAMLSETSARNEGAVFIDDEIRKRLLMGLFDAYYHNLAPETVVFDTNRGWTTKLPALVELFPDAKMICCVRNIAWTLDSVERLVRRNAFELSGIFSFDSSGTVYSRVEGLASAAGMVGFALNALREAVYGSQSDRLLLVRYESLIANPLGTLAAIYGFSRRAAAPARSSAYRALLRHDRIRSEARHARPARCRPRRSRAQTPHNPAAGPLRSL